jgi:hypothetical protein
VQDSNSASTVSPVVEHLRPVAVLLLVTAIHATTAVAQPASAMPGRLELAAGLLWTGAQGLGSRDANLTTGTGATLRLFSSTSDLLAVAGFQARVGVKVARAIEMEARASYASPQLRTRVSSDTENSAGASIAETVQQYNVGAGVVWYLPSRRSGSRVKPFATAGASYLRQLHEAATLISTGQTYHVGGGAKLLLASRTLRGKGWKGVGVRLDAGAVVRTKGITFDGRRSISPAVGASLFARF